MKALHLYTQRQLLRHASWIMLATTAMMIGGCTTAQFTEYRGGQVIAGRGGAVRSINGIDLWHAGEPDRPYRIIAILDIESIYSKGNFIHRSAVRQDVEAHITKAVMKAGGHAAMLVSESSEVVGSTTATFGSANTSGTVTGSGTANTTFNNYGGALNANTTLRGSANYSGNTTYSGASGTSVINLVGKRVAIVRYVDEAAQLGPTPKSHASPEIQTNSPTSLKREQDF